MLVTEKCDTIVQKLSQNVNASFAKQSGKRKNSCRVKWFNNNCKVINEAKKNAKFNFIENAMQTSSPK